MQSKPQYLGPALIATVAVLIVGGMIYYFSSSRSMPEGLIVANGRIESDRIIAAAKYPGRVLKVLAKEGDSVAAGALVAELEDQSVQAKAEQARQALNATEAQWQAAQASLAIAQKELPLNQAVADAGYSQAEAAAGKAAAVEQQMHKDAERHQQLFEQGVIERHRWEQAELGWQVAKADLQTARQAQNRARQAQAEAQLGSDKIAAKRQEVDALKAQRERAAAAVTEAGSVLQDMQIHAPAGGVVLARLREPGEVVLPGGAILEMANLDQLYLKVYVPESRIGQLKLGLPARIYIDSQPGKYYQAKVSYISARAEFTPKEVQTSDERVKMMYAVKLTVTSNPEHKLTPGLPADAVIRWKEAVEWQAPRWN